MIQGLHVGYGCRAEVLLRDFASLRFWLNVVSALAVRYRFRFGIWAWYLGKLQS